MNVICRHCSAEYSYLGANQIVSKCPECGKMQGRSYKNDYKALIILLIPCLLAAWLIVTCSNAGGKNSEFNATAYARGYALSQLRDRSSGESTIRFVKQNGDEWEILGTVSGLNMMGGRTIHSWRAVLKYGKDYSENYIMVSFELGEPY